MSDVYLVWRNLTRKRMRFALTLFAIFIAFLIYGVLGSFRAAFQVGVDTAADDRLVTVNKINFTQPLPLAYVGKIRAMEGIRVVTHQSWFGGYVKEPKDVIVCMAIEPDTYLDVYETEFNLPADQKAAFLHDRQGAIVGERLAREQGWKLGDRVPIHSNIFTKADGSSTWEMVIDGIFTGKSKTFDTNRMAFHYDYLNEARSFAKDMTGMIISKAVDSTQNDRLLKAIDTQFANSFHETQSDSATAFNKAFIAQMGNIALIITSVVSAAFFTILLIVGNTMMLAIRERTTEIAVLKTLGFHSARIFRLVLGESMFLALLGGALGLGVAALAVAVLKVVAASAGPELSLTPVIAAQGCAIMLGLGLVTGVLPAWSAMRLNIVSALGRGGA